MNHSCHSKRATPKEEEWIWAEATTSPNLCSLKCVWLVLSQCNLCNSMWQASIDLPSTYIIWEYTLFHYILSGLWPNKSSWSLFQLPLLFPVRCRAPQSCIISVDFLAPNCCPLTNSSQARACSCLLGFLSWQELSWCCLCIGALVPVCT